MSNVLNWIVKSFIRLFFPGLAQDLQTEGHFDFRDKSVSLEDVDPDQYISVEDNGSDVTLISFAGMAVLYAGMPRFEFRKILKENDNDYNLIFVRDIHRGCYFMAPDGSANGVEYYAGLIGDALEKLGSSFNVVLGASGGGMASFCIGSRLNVHRIVTFNPAFPLNEFGRWEMIWKQFLNIPKLFREPSHFFEPILVAISAGFLWRRLCRLIGEENIPNVMELYQAHEPDPIPATIYYSERSLPDGWQAESIADVPGITLVKANSGRHNCMLDLKLRGELGASIQRVVDEGLAEREAK